MQRNICGKWCLRKVHFTNSSRAGCEVGGGASKIPYDWCPANWRRQRSGNRNRSQRERMTFRQTWSSLEFTFFWSDPLFSGTSYLPLLFSSQKKAKMIRRKRRRTRKRPRSLRRSRYKLWRSEEKLLRYISRFSNTSSRSSRWWPCGTPSRLTSPRTGSTRSNWTNWSLNSFQSKRKSLQICFGFSPA